MSESALIYALCAIVLLIPLAIYLMSLKLREIRARAAAEKGQ